MALKLQLLFNYCIRRHEQGVSNSTNPRSRLLDPLLAEAIASIRYGAVEITIHDGRIVQIEKREKLRPAEPSDNGRNAA